MEQSVFAQEEIEPIDGSIEKVNKKNENLFQNAFGH